MQMLIQYRHLIDFPYDPKKTEFHLLFEFDKPKVSNLVSELLYASPTCYLVSGYRGAGKTSFIKRVQQLCQEQFRKTEQTKGMIFVYSSFSRFENKTIFLRKIIRDLHETVKNEQQGDDLKNLYATTFYQITHEESNENVKEASAKISLDTVDFFKKIAARLSPLLLIVSNYILSPWFAQMDWKWVIVWKSLIFLISIGVTILGLINFNMHYAYKESYTKKKTKVSPFR